MTTEGPQSIPTDRLFAQYGITHLKLTVAEETIQRQSQQIAALSKQLQDALAKLAKYTEATNAKPQSELTKVSEIKLPHAQEAQTGEARTAQDG